MTHLPENGQGGNTDAALESVIVLILMARLLPTGH